MDGREQRIAELEEALRKCLDRVTMLGKVIGYQREHYGLLERAYNALLEQAAAGPPTPPGPEGEDIPTAEGNAYAAAQHRPGLT